MGIVYRSWQFWQALIVTPSVRDMELARSILSTELMHLFELMQPEEQIHCIKTAYILIEKEHVDEDLLAAALLHDVGKTNFPLQIWERVWLVVGNTFFPKLAMRWRRQSDLKVLEKRNWRRVFVVYHRHAEWGAEMARKAGASQLCTNLIRRHQDRVSFDMNSIEDQLLYYLQEADNLS